jgi:hypothetical protein
VFHQSEKSLSRWRILCLQIMTIQRLSIGSGIALGNAAAQ